MLDLGKFSFLEIDTARCGQVYAIYSHTVHMNENGDCDQIYGWEVEKDRLIIPSDINMLAPDSLIDIDIDSYQSGKTYLYSQEPCTFRVSKHSMFPPCVFVQFKTKLLSHIISNNIKVYYDYMDSGFYQLDDTEFSSITSDAESYAEYGGEWLVIKREDNDMITRLTKGVY